MSYPNYGFPGYPNNIQSGTADTLGISWVSSIEEVRSYHVPFGKQVFMDRNQDIFYVKNTAGEIKAFSFKETSIPSLSPENYVTKQEFDELRTKYEQLIQQQSAATGTQSFTNNATDATVQGITGGSQTAAMQPVSVDGNNANTAQQLA